MNKRLWIAIAVFLFACGFAGAQDNKQSNTGSKSDSAEIETLSHKSVSMTGKVGSDGETLVTDKDTHSYKVLNPEFVEQNSGQHVKVTARVSEDKKAIMVSSVMVQEAPPTSTKKNDSSVGR